MTSSGAHASECGPTIRRQLIALAASGTLLALPGCPVPAAAMSSLRSAPTVRTSTDVAGSVVDRSGQPIRDATITIPELNRAASSAADGRFRFKGVPQGRYTLAVRRLGYAGTARSIVVAGSPLDVRITLEEGALPIEPVNVTAARAPVAAMASPLATGVLTGEQVHPDGGISLSHSVAQLAGVRNVSSGQQVGKPMIRGLFGPRVLVLTNGSRVEDYSWSNEDGPSVDARLAERIEVIRGPASVLYGSEALGGVINVVPAELPYRADGSSMRRSAIEAYGATNNAELGSAGMIEGSHGRYGWRGLATGRFANNVRTPRGALQNSSFFAVTGEGAFGVNSAHGNTTVRAAHYGGEFHLLESRGPDLGDSAGGPVRQTLDDRVQITNDYVARGLRLETKAQWQRHSLTEVSDECQPAPGQITCARVKDQRAFGLVLNTGTVDLLAHHTAGEHLTGTVGLSGMYQLSGTSGPIFLVPSATTAAGGAFSFEQLTFGPVGFVTGLRVDTRRLSSDASAPLALSADARRWSATSGDIGVVIHPVPALSVLANLGTGWRAPTLFDLYTNGPNVGDARYEIGDSALRSERDHNIDGGFRWASERARADLSIFQNLVDDFIYLAPTPQTISGLRVFRHRQSNARLTGAEVSASVDVSEPFTVRASYDYVNGSDRATGTPLPLMPPPRLVLGANLHATQLGGARRAAIGVELERNAAQTRLDPGEIPSEEYTLLNLSFAMDRVIGTRPIRFGIDVRNATNASYRDFLSRYKSFAYGQGVNVMFRASSGAW